MVSLSVTGFTSAEDGGAFMRHFSVFVSYLRPKDFTVRAQGALGHVGPHRPVEHRAMVMGS